MPPPALLHHLVLTHAMRAAPALKADGTVLAYARLAGDIEAFAAGLMNLALPRGGRVAVWLDKRAETVIACFGTAAAGGVFVPVNPVLKPAQVGHILRDSGAMALVTNAERLATLDDTLATCPALAHVVLAPPPTRPPAHPAH
ncbi:MAG: AMP-binding protein, partial [Azoarcus sp.]|nr:AMP-binding protein [Azoarcus sp.]